MWPFQTDWIKANFNLQILIRIRRTSLTNVFTTETSCSNIRFSASISLLVPYKLINGQLCNTAHPSWIINDSRTVMLPSSKEKRRTDKATAWTVNVDMDKITCPCQFFSDHVSVRTFLLATHNLKSDYLIKRKLQ